MQRILPCAGTLPSSSSHRSYSWHCDGPTPTGKTEEAACSNTRWGRQGARALKKGLAVEVGARLGHLVQLWTRWHHEMDRILAVKWSGRKHPAVSRIRAVSGLRRSRAHSIHAQEVRRRDEDFL